MTHPTPRSRPWTGALGALAASSLLHALSSQAGDVSSRGDATRGAVIFALAGGCGCHTPKGGPVGAGGTAIETPFGKFYSTNITSDRRTGLGEWSDEEIDRALRSGRLRDGSAESPVMPYDQYAGMADSDASDLIAYLRTLPPVEREDRPHQVSLPLPRLAFAAWRWLFAERPTPPDVAPATGVERGRYLSDHVGICGDCHTPRNRFGVRDGARYLAGVAKGPRGELVPNLTSDPATGIGSWDEDEIAGLLKSGFKPDFDNVQGLMAEMVDGIGGGAGLGQAPESDLQAIAAYIKKVPPIANALHSRDSGAGTKGEK